VYRVTSSVVQPKCGPFLCVKFVELIGYIQANSELEKVRSQLLQETQLRAVAEAYLMEERALWQQATAAAADTSQRCLHMHDVLNALGSVTSSSFCLYNICNSYYF
jgi:hypothetical protein